MANKEEEDYLDSLLNSLSSKKNTNTIDNFDTVTFEDKPVEETESVEVIDTEENNELDDILNELNIDEGNQEDVVEESTEIDDIDDDMDSKFLSQMLLDGNDAIEEAAPSEESISEEQDDISVEDLLNNLQNNTFDDTDTDAEPMSLDDLSSLFANEEPKESEETPTMAIDENELADILALDEGVSLDDIPNELPENALTEEENNMLNDMMEDIPDLDAVSEEEPKKKKKGKKEKKKKAKKGFKDFIKNFDDGDDESPTKKDADANQQLLDEVYGDKDSLDDEAIDENGAPKKEKKKKEKKPKEKKEKKPKEKKEKKPKDTTPQPTVPMKSLIKVVLFVVIVCVGVIVSSKIVTYNIHLKNAKNLYSNGSYTAAYAIVDGMDIKNKDKEFYMKARTMASLYQGMESYDTYMKIDDKANAVAALVKTVSRKIMLDEQIIKYDVIIPAETVYTRVLSMLNKYGITEEMALDFNSITDYEEFMKKMSTFGGISVDSDN